MAVPAKRITAIDAAKYEVTWGTDTLGWIKEVDPSGIELLTREKTIGEIDDLVVDEEIYGIKGAVKMVLHEVDSERMRQLCPWASATGVFTLAPTVDAYSCYANSKLLTIHPKSMGVVTTSDFTWAHAFPMFTLPKSAGGKTWRELPVTFKLYLDQTALTASPATKVLGYQGTTPS